MPILLAGGVGCSFEWQNPLAADRSPSLASPPASGSSTLSLPPATAIPEGSSLDVERGLRRLDAQVSLLRGLYPATQIRLRVLPPEALRTKLVDECMAQMSPEAVTAEAKELAMLGLLDSDFDLASFYEDLASEWADHLASSYDELLGELVLADPPALDPSTTLTYIGSYSDALRAEHFGIGSGVACCPVTCAASGDAGLALAALIQGDTNLVQEQWVRTFAGESDAGRLEASIGQIGVEAIDRAPRFLKEVLLFPVVEGRAFVHDLYLDGDWPAVDRAYEDPPASTEQVLHPALYPEGGPLAIEAPDLSSTLGTMWPTLRVGVLGELLTREVLEAYLPEEEAAEAAAGWGGDVLLTSRNAESGAGLLILITRWDNLRQAQDFALAFRPYGLARFGERKATERGDTWAWDGGYSLLERASDQTLWILAPDKATAEIVRAGLVFPAPNR